MSQQDFYKRVSKVFTKENEEIKEDEEVVGVREGGEDTRGSGKRRKKTSYLQSHPLKIHFAAVNTYGIELIKLIDQ